MEDALAFAEELEEVALQLSSLDPLAEEPEAIAATAADTIAEYERLSMTAAMFGVDGVKQTAAWIGNMLSGYQEGLPEAILELLQGGQLFSWIELAAIALREPEDPSHLAALGAELMDEAWPEPPSPATIQQLLLDLRTAALPPASMEIDVGEDTDTAANPDATDDTPAHNPLAWDQDIHPELLDAYLQETPGQVTEAASLIHLIARNEHSPEQKRHAARLAHTIKGASAVVGVEAISSFTHRLEDILEMNIASHLSHGLDETLSAAADCLETLFDNLVEHKGLPDAYHTLLADMDAWEKRLEEEPPTTSKPTDDDDSTPFSLPPADPSDLPDFITQSATNVEDEPTEQATVAIETPRSTSTHLSVPVETVQRLLNLAGELITSTSQIAEHAQRTLEYGKQVSQQDEHIRQMLEALDETIDQQSSSLHQSSGLHLAPGDPDSMKLDELELEGYNDLHSVSGLLTESIADNRELSRNLQQHVRQVSEQVYQQQRLQRQLSETILRTRLVPVQSIVARMERTVRETCRQTGKQASITIHGQNLQVDTDILQGLSAPLMHMLRNAIDHGIEGPEERQSANKPAEGRLELSFEQKGSQIHMTLSDDGRGLDVERIRARAIERGLITPEQQLDEEEVLRLILQPGFSTREQVSEVSGRGIGMDVVQAAVQNLQGLLHLHSEPGKGTRIHIQAPLTLIATNALLVRSAGNLIAIPGSTIQQLLYVSPEEHIQEENQWHIEHQGNKLEIIQLARLLGWRASLPPMDKGHSLLLVESGQHLHALHVDEILQPRDIVVKSLSPWLNLTQGVSGACILANGEVAPVLDMLRLLRNLEQGKLELAAIDTAPRIRSNDKHRILIVDDSLSNRKAVSLMVKQMGYEAITAVDGLDALQQLHEQTVEVVLTDLEMPRMNGLEMTQAIRIWPEKRHLPIIMITSRSTKKHQQMAQEAGVDDYLTKPVDQTTLNVQLQKWLNTQLAA